MCGVPAEILAVSQAGNGEGGKHKRPASEEDEDAVASNAGSGPSTGETAITFFTAGLQPPIAKPSDLLAAEAAPSEPIVVYTGPTKTGPALIAAVAMDSEQQTPPHRGKKKSRVAAKKPDTGAEPAAAKHAKPDGAPKVAEKPAKPKSVVKPKPAPKNTTSQANPVDQKPATAPHT